MWLSRFFASEEKPDSQHPRHLHCTASVIAVMIGESWAYSIIGGAAEIVLFLTIDESPGRATRPHIEMIE
jgi:hypothetical protein